MEDSGVTRPSSLSLGSSAGDDVDFRNAYSDGCKSQKEETARRLHGKRCWALVVVFIRNSDGFGWISASSLCLLWLKIVCFSSGEARLCPMRRKLYE